MIHSKAVISTHDFMGGVVTVYLVRYSGGIVFYEYGADLWVRDYSPMFISLTHNKYSDETSAMIGGYIAIMSHVVG